jgi:hypothetical protein
MTSCMHVDRTQLSIYTAHALYIAQIDARHKRIWNATLYGRLVRTARQASTVLIHDHTKTIDLTVVKPFISITQ